MSDYIIFMYDDAPQQGAGDDETQWGLYFEFLHRSGCFEGGSSIGSGTRLRKGSPPQVCGDGMNGFIRVRAESLDQAIALLAGNPAYEAGATVELRELLRDG